MVLVTLGFAARSAGPDVALERYNGGDVGTSAKIWELTCRLGDAQSCFHLGIRAQQGFRTAPDAPRARQLFEQACTGGSPMGCTNFGFYLYRGEGGAIDSSAALEAWLKACAGNESLGCAQLGDVVSRP